MPIKLHLRNLTRKMMIPERQGLGELTWYRRVETFISYHASFEERQMEKNSWQESQRNTTFVIRDQTPNTTPDKLRCTLQNSQLDTTWDTPDPVV